MNSADIWQSICKYLDVEEILRLRVLSKRHNSVGVVAAKSRSLVIDNDEILRQVFAWIINSVRMRAMIPSRYEYLSSDEYSDDYDDMIAKEQEAYDYVLESCESKEGFYFDPDDYSENEEVPARLIPETMNLFQVVYLSYDLQLDNPKGPNKNPEGCIWPNVEISDFHSTWKWKKGFMDLNKLADGYFRLRSHKFDNWNELVHDRIDVDVGVTEIFHGKLNVEHGP